MSRELIRRGAGLPVSRGVMRATSGLANAAQIEQAVIRAQSAVGEFAVSEVFYLKSMQKDLELRDPAAADAISLIVNTTVHSIARSVARFGTEIS